MKAETNLEHQAGVEEGRELATTHQTRGEKDEQVIANILQQVENGEKKKRTESVSQDLLD